MSTFTGNPAVELNERAATEIVLVVRGRDEPAPCAEDGPGASFLAGGGKPWDLGARELPPFLGQVQEGVEREEGGEEGSHGIAEGVDPRRGEAA
jgi:hypothetical protein